jgi:uncharacterized membrane protein YccC
VLSWLRMMYAASEGRAAPVYGLVSGIGVSTPLVVGVLTGRAAESGLVGLGAFYVASAGPTGPYGARARTMLATVAVVAVFTWFGGLFSGDPWLATVIVPIVAAAGAAIRWMGPIAALSTLVAAIRPPTSPVLFIGVLEMLGGLWVTVLMLAPWITHRLRPLRTSVAEATRAVADAFDLLSDTDSAEWDRRRSNAYDALRQARATYALYRGGLEEQESHDRPHRLVEALDRAMDEAVALRSPLGALRGEAPPRRWEQEFGVVVAALGDRLREIAATVEQRRGTPSGDGSVALERFVRVSDDVRRQWLDGREELFGTALILQVRRIIGRIAATLDGADEIVARGLKIGFDTTLPERPAGVWAGVREAVATGSPGFRHAARVGTAIAVAMALANGLHLPYGHWLPITVIFSLRDSYGATVERVVRRVGGATVGGTAAALALALAPGGTTLILLVFVGAALGFALSSVNHAYWVMFGTPMIMLLVDFTEPLGWKAAGWRIGLTAAGGVLALASARVLWPAGTLRLLPAQLFRLLHTHAESARAVAALFDRRPDVPVHRRTHEAASAAVDVEESLNRLAREPAPSEDPLRRLGDVLATARRLRDYVATLAALAGEHLGDAGPIPVILERVADHLDAGADTGELEIEDLLGELDEHLSALCRQRRAEIAGGTDSDVMTSLREALVEVAGARHALRALAEDADRVTEEIRELIGQRC